LLTFRSPKRPTGRWHRASTFGAVIAFVATLTVASPASAQLAPPWDGNPISPGLGPTYGEAWCDDAAPGSNIANQQNQPLALMPAEAIECTLDQFLVEGAEAGIAVPRMSYGVIGQSAGQPPRDLFGVVVNALETPEQIEASENWFALRNVMLTDPAQGQALLAGWGDAVKIPIFIEANIHGNEEESTDAIMQVIRDLVTTPYGVNATVDDLLDHAILVVIPSQNPDGRARGTRANVNGFDMNRDLLVQSQPEIRANVAFQQQWLAPVGIAMHGYVDPTLIDGLTKPHNPGVEYDLFLEWNQPRVDENEAALDAVGMNITRPVLQWNSLARKTPKPVGPAYAEGWDDWGPFYTQTYMEFFGVDSSTLEMCNAGPGCKGRFGAKRAQYVGFYSSATFWTEHRNDILQDQVEIFRRGVTSAPRPLCCGNPFIALLGFTEDQHNWMVPYPEAFVIPFGGGGQRSDAEANRMVQWLLDNGIQVERADAPFDWNGATYPTGTYVVWMDQALRGLAYTTLSAGQDISERITQLYAPPGAWSHGLLWGADVFEVPVDPTFAPGTTPITEPNPLAGGVAAGDPAAYAITLRGVGEVRAILGLLRDEVDGEVAEESFTSASAGEMPAGSLLFDAADADELAAAGLASGVVFEAVLAGDLPDETTQLDEAPRVAMLAGGTGRNDTLWSLEQIFGSDVQVVTMTSILNAGTDPLLPFDVIYNAGQAYPSEPQSDVARDRLSAFFDRGGGYIGTSQSVNNFGFLNASGLLTSPLAQGSDAAGGGIAVWSNDGVDGPLTGGFPAQDFLYLPSNITYFSAVPDEATVDGRYLSNTDDLFLAGLWRDRNAAVADAPTIVHGTTTAESRFLGLATNPFSRGDAEREWALIGQAALWSNLTDG
jgi:zinc carboxypeptidase